MEIIRVGGFDPGLRFAGYGIVNYNAETNEIWVSNCGVVKNSSSAKTKGLDALMDMIHRVKPVSDRECFSECDNVVVEVPAAIYSKNFSSGSLIPVGAIAGSLLTLFDPDKVIPVYPTVWNSRRKKDDSRERIESVLGSHEDWLYDDCPKAKSQFEHIIDAVGMALWYLETQYLDE